MVVVVADLDSEDFVCLACLSQDSKDNCRSSCWSLDRPSTLIAFGPISSLSFEFFGWPNEFLELSSRSCTVMTC